MTTEQPWKWRRVAIKPTIRQNANCDHRRGFTRGICKLFHLQISEFCVILDLFRRSRKACFWLLVSVGLYGISSSRLAGQEVLAAPQLSIECPSKQTVYAFIRYYVADRVDKTVTRRLTANIGETREPLEFGFDGLHVRLAIPTRLPLTVALLDGGRIVQEVKSKSIGFIDIKYGEVSDSDVFELPRVFPNDREEELIRVFISCMQEADTKEIVSTSKAAKIQWQTLDAFCEAVEENLGEYKQVADPPDGWLTWDGNFNTRVFSGPLAFERANCLITFVVADGLLFDVSFDCEEIPENWFRGPASDALFVEKSALLAKRLFALDDPQQAQEVQAMFGPQFHENVTPEALLELSQRISARYGAGPEAISHVASELGNFDPEDESYDLQVFHLLQMKNEKQCISQVTVEFSCGPGRIGRGDVASIEIVESWPSAAPKAAENARRLFERLDENESCLDLFHPEVRLLLHAEKLDRWTRQTRKQLGSLVVEPQLSIWTARENGQNASAQGKVKFSEGTFLFRVDFSDDQLIGLTISGSDLAAQSMGNVASSEEVSALAGRFWNELLAGEVKEAHTILADRFRERLPLVQFEQLVNQSDFADPREVERLETDQVVVSTRADRSLPGLVAVYQLAQFEDGSFQPLRTEFSRQDGSWQLMNFNSDFQAYLVGSMDYPGYQELVRSVLNGDGDTLINLVSEDMAATAEPAIVDAFLRRANQVLDNDYYPEAGQCWHDYRLGKRYATFNTSLRKRNQAPVGFAATFDFDELISFVIQEPQTFQFLNQVQDRRCFDRKSVEVVEDWMSGRLDAAVAAFTSSLRDGRLKSRLMQLKSNLLVTNGPYVEVRPVARQLDPQSNLVVCWLDVEFRDSTVPIKVTLEVDALTCWIRGFEPELVPE